MSELLRFFKDMRDNGYGLAEIAAQLGTSAIAEPVAGFAAMYDPAHGADAIREGMTYQPRTQEAQEYSQSIGNAAKTAIKPAMPIIDTWKKGVDIAGQYSPVVGAGLRTVPTAIGIAMGAKPALQAGRQVSEGLGAMQGRMIANANAPSTLNTAGFRGQRGVFAGINALTADKEALAKAQQMIAQGVDPAQVWKETGWGKGVDGKWRFEIDDSQINLHDKNLRDVYNISDAMSENDLLKAYPILKDDFLAIGRNDRHLGGAEGMMTDSTTPNQKSIAINRELSNNGNIKNDDLKSVLMHEVQHAIQDREGFARGGSPQTVNQSTFRENQAKYFDDLITQLEEKLPKPNQQWIDDIHDPIEAQIEKIKEQKYNLSNSNVGFDAYRSLAGEVEARTTQSRLNLDPQQRRENYPFDYKAYGYDVPAKSQTVDFGNNKANAQRPLLATTAPLVPTTALGAYMYNEKRKKSQGNQ
jgi:hypothetical protein